MRNDKLERAREIAAESDEELVRRLCSNPVALNRLLNDVLAAPEAERAEWDRLNDGDRFE